MLTNKNLGSRLLWICALVICCLVAGCTPPGPKALLEGKRLMDEGKWDESIPRLQEATELLATNALAWSYLGLAYHQTGRFDQSFKAYQMALKLDHTMVSLRFNLGCLYLDLNNLNGAIDELRAFTLLQPSVADGWVKLGTAQYRARRLDEAEKSFRGALALQPRNAEALNGQGLIQVQRHRWPEAVNLFNTAATHDTNFAPAVLNAAVIYHQYLNSRPLALQYYRRYLELNPSGSDDVRSTVAQLDRELHPVTPTNRPPPAVAAVSPRTNQHAASVPSSAERERTGSGGGTAKMTSPVTNTQPSMAAASSPPTRGPGKLTELIPITKPPTNPRAAESSRVTAPTNPPPRQASVVTNQPAKPPVAPDKAPAPPALEVARIQEDVVVRPAQDVNSQSPSTGRASTNTSMATPAANRASSSVDMTPPPRKGFFSRLNPFSRGGAETSPPPRSVASREISRPEGLPELPPPSVVRYRYLSPQRPGDGNREEAVVAFKRGIKAQKSSDRARAAAEYQAALRTDPGFFDAYYNLGLVALESGDARLSLWAYELALSIQPDSGDARYNLALALKAGGYPLDAVEELERLLKANPSDSRAHLSLGNLFAQQLKQPRRAREHYLRVLELNPRHPEAATIRYWLAANP